MRFLALTGRDRFPKPIKIWLWVLLRLTDPTRNYPIKNKESHNPNSFSPLDLRPLPPPRENPKSEPLLYLPTQIRRPLPLALRYQIPLLVLLFFPAFSLLSSSLAPPSLFTSSYLPPLDPLTDLDPSTSSRRMPHA